MNKTRKEICHTYYKNHKEELIDRCKAYEKTPRGFLMRTYRNMLNRVSGINKKAAPLYAGLPILDKGQFYEWALSSADFHDLFDEYIVSGFNKKKAPSVDRIDTSKGYLLSNMQWLTLSDNSKKGAETRWKKS